MTTEKKNSTAGSKLLMTKRKKISADKTTTNKKDKTLIEIDASDDEDGTSKERWIDSHVHSLISFRAEMDGEFEQQAGKQRMNTWLKLHRRMIVSCRGFNKTAEACKKKWQAEYKKYKIDKRHLQLSGNDRKITRKYYQIFYEAFQDRANVKKAIHSDASGSENPCPLEPDATS
ncbi:hypothetical protein R1flu_027483 [Riccia fluitans]|uniref:Myb/SANT-like DNA-binding domain-containing protein n=1 Tax=Riccia fluitans TaxID=41844 RepID=A0ABD1XJ08_9MARC